MTLLLLQIAIVLATVLLCGSIARKLGQSRVIGEIIGGILLGPSVLARIAPHLSATLFPPQSLGPFDILSNIGLILFLFLIGTELDYKHLREQRLTATVTSTGSILLPFLLGILISPGLYHRFAPPGVSQPAFTLFLGISMSITAFPVLARILEERNLQSTPLGTTALLCAAVDDVCAWLLLAVALTLLPSQISSQTSAIPIAPRLLWLVIYLAAMLFVIRPLASRLARRYPAFSYETFAIIIALVLASAAATAAIGVHPLFGAFLAGLCLPRIPEWQSTIRTYLNSLVSVLLLPLFFALTGMRTRLDLLTGTQIWLWTALILILAVAGKVGGAVLAARLTGQTWQHSLALGALLNTRGLVELIVLNIAYNAHVFTPTLFTMFVLMALVTTMMTTPLLNLLRIESA